ncbi:NADH-quinone oxidoreductase subunit L [Ignavibacteriales bacterium]
MTEYIYLAVLFPLIGFLINGLFGRLIKNEKIIGGIGAGMVGLAFLVIVFSFFETLGLPADQRSRIITWFTWIKTGGIDAAFSYQVDQLSLTMSLIVTGVGFVIHVYSIGYMHGEKAFWRFFAYMNLFIVAMMNLVLADNFVLLFLGWEGVGLCSYLLIGFYYDRKFEKGTVADASKKAFVVNRIGDFGFLVAMFFVFYYFKSLNFSEVLPLVAGSGIEPWIFEAIAIFLFIGATGKSAQIPLFVWLPDAMAGPTPVSALIHAATMVTAGVYLVARTSIIFAMAPTAMMVVAIIGLFTALFAATIGLVQNDIKKVLAYSTVSQLGYMFLALGMGAFSAGIFHVMTHAFFKALLFLGAGSVIHGMHEEQDIRNYGGLKKYMPKTYITFAIAAVAISGIPPLSGFFSKDEILWMAYANGGLFFWIIGAITALMTAFYMFRLLSLTFEGKERFDHHHVHPHESPNIMIIPLMILAVLSIIGGFIGLPKVFVGEHGNLFEVWLAPIFKDATRKLATGNIHSHLEEYLLMATSVVGAVASIMLARHIYLRKPEIATGIADSFKGVYKTLLNKYYVDEFYQKVVITPLVKISDTVLFRFTDAKIIDGAVNGTAKAVEFASKYARQFQTGITQFYAVVMMIAIVGTLFWIILSF